MAHDAGRVGARTVRGFPHDRFELARRAGNHEIHEAAYCTLARAVWNRVLAVFRAGFDAQWGAGSWPAAPLVMHGSLAAVLCGLVHGELAPFAYALFALSVSGALIALPLLGDFGALLSADAAAEWVEALPVRKIELRIARTLLIFTLIGALSLAALVPAALLAPESIGVAGRFGLVIAGLGQALFLAAALLGVNALLGERAAPLLVLLQTLLVAGIVIGFVAGLRFVPRMAPWRSPADASAVLAGYPPAWFAASFAPASATSIAWRCAAWIAALIAVATLALAPLPRIASARKSGGWLALALRPLRALAVRSWVRQSERASFELVFDALPLEREFVLRTYPMFGIPLAFLVAGARGAPGPAHDGLLAVLLFTPAIYLPILLVHVQATASPHARWMLETAPVSRASIDNGALKAVALRFCCLCTHCSSR